MKYEVTIEKPYEQSGLTGVWIKTRVTLHNRKAALTYVSAVMDEWDYL